VAGAGDDRNAAIRRQAVMQSPGACADFMRFNAHFPAQPLKIVTRGDFA
jgi:hypothetical protein